MSRLSRHEGSTSTVLVSHLVVCRCKKQGQKPLIYLHVDNISIDEISKGESQEQEKSPVFLFGSTDVEWEGEAVRNAKRYI